jgi:hypothetical protein
MQPGPIHTVPVYYSGWSSAAELEREAKFSGIVQAFLNSVMSAGRTGR